MENTAWSAYGFLKGNNLNAAFGGLRHTNTWINTIIVWLGHTYGCANYWAYATLAISGFNKL